MNYETLIGDFDGQIQRLQAENAELKAKLSVLTDIHAQTVKDGIAGFKAVVTENAALKEQVAQLVDDLAAFRLFQTNVEATHKETLRGLQTVLMREEEQLTALQAKSAALVDALETVKRYLSVGNSTSAYNYIFVELAAFKGEK